jgi:16S rRNA (adenine1518-N6/adenine1519-N6)-dimethyltransferase
VNRVRAKKHLGQHFLKNQEIAKKIVDSLTQDVPNTILEIGPGMGVLTQYLLNIYNDNLFVIEIDSESVKYLKNNYPALSPNIIEADFLKYNLKDSFENPIGIIGNFPYNISSQILFKMIDNRDLIPQLVGMFQKEVAERIAAGPGSKTYGILSVLLQTYFNVEYLFTVDEDVFDPPPKVKSGVIRVTRNDRKTLSCNEKLYFRVIKTAFNQRRKTLSNSLKSILLNLKPENEIFRKRPEQLSVEEFIELTNIIDKLL